MHRSCFGSASPTTQGTKSGEDFVDVSGSVEDAPLGSAVACGTVTFVHYEKELSAAQQAAQQAAAGSGSEVEREVEEGQQQAADAAMPQGQQRMQLGAAEDLGDAQQAQQGSSLDGADELEIEDEDWS